MEKFSLVKRAREAYLEGKNIMQFLKEGKDGENSLDDILISYDLQSGSYIDLYNKNPEQKEQYVTPLASILNKIDFHTILEVGIGEATTLATLLKKLEKKDAKAFGFDLSWSRIKYAQRFVGENGLSDRVTLFTGDLFKPPLRSDSVDVVYTSHSIEPNGGREREALLELLRITKKYLILLEPAYDLANEEARARMERLGYVKNIQGELKGMNVNILEHRLYDHSVNPLNPTGITIIEKSKVGSPDVNIPLACPISGTQLEEKDGCLFSKESLLAYPVIKGVPCLLPSNAIVATHFEEF